MLPWVCTVKDHRKRHNVVGSSVTHSAAPLGSLFCSHRILTSSVIYYLTEVWPTESICETVNGLKVLENRQLNLSKKFKNDITLSGIREISNASLQFLSTNY